MASGRLSYWDALLLTSAREIGVKVMLSEDMQDGFRFGVIEVVNPFAPEGGLSVRARLLFEVARVVARREGRASEEPAELAIALDQCALAASWTHFDGRVVANDRHVRVFHKFHGEWRHTSGPCDQCDLAPRSS